MKLMDIAVDSQVLILSVAKYRLLHHALLNKTHPLEAADRSLVDGQAVGSQAVKPPVVASQLNHLAERSLPQSQPAQLRFTNQ